jgi:hypothetical protein
LPLEASSSAHSTAAENAGSKGSAGPAAAVGVCWSPRLLALQSWLSQHPSVCVVDPFEHTAKVPRVQQPGWAGQVATLIGLYCALGAGAGAGGRNC